ncbi:MAG: hypothetical protein ACYTGG_13015, partial [Planctomycetota bacterium]
MTGLIEAIRLRLEPLPRAIRWAIYAAIGLVLFFAWDGMVRPVSNDLAEQVDRMERNLESLRSSERLTREFRSMRDTVVALGSVGLPGDIADGQAALSGAINEIRNDFTVQNDSFRMRSGGRVNVRLTGIPPGKQVQELAGEFKFDASKDDATAIIARLESNPDIEAIRRLSI